MRISPLYQSYFSRCARRAGGLFLGFRFHFPVTIWDGPYTDIDGCDRTDVTNTTFQRIYCGFGFLFWELRFNIDYDIKPITDE